MHEEVGQRVSAILDAAAQAAEGIRGQARGEADAGRRWAKTEAAGIRRRVALAAPGRARARTPACELPGGEADGYALEARGAAKARPALTLTGAPGSSTAYATRGRGAEEKAGRAAAQSETQGRAVRQPARAMAGQLQGGVRERLQQLHEETRALEERRERTLENVREISSHLQDLEAGSRSTGYVPLEDALRSTRCP